MSNLIPFVYCRETITITPNSRSWLTKLQINCNNYMHNYINYNRKNENWLITCSCIYMYMYINYIVQLKKMKIGQLHVHV